MGSALDNNHDARIASLRRFEFPQLFIDDDSTSSSIVFADHAGSTLPCRTQLEAIQSQLLANLYSNPHSHHAASRSTTDEIDSCRQLILSRLNVDDRQYDVVFTQNASAALRLLAESFRFDGQEVVYLRENHTSALALRDCAAAHTAVKCLDEEEMDAFRPNAGSLVVLPAQCNFSGRRFPIKRWLERWRSTNDQHSTLVDIACLAASAPVDLHALGRPSFAVLSFYKIFGYPTGLGALLVRLPAVSLRERRLFQGGGTVDAIASGEKFLVPRGGHSQVGVSAISDDDPSTSMQSGSADLAKPHERLEDGTLPFQEILSIRHGYAALDRIGGGLSTIEQHTFRLAQHFARQLQSLRHANSKPAAVLYSRFDDNAQGPIIAFNALNDAAQFVGYSNVAAVLDAHRIAVRTGCCCNIGACERYLALDLQRIRSNYERHGHACGDAMDLIDGRPTGAVRVSFGYMSTMEDVERILMVYKTCFTTGAFVRSSPTIEPATGMRLSEAFFYPLKSAGAIDIDSAHPINAAGFQLDRAWMFVEQRGSGYRALTQKRLPLLASMRPSIVDGELILRQSGVSLSTPIVGCDTSEEMLVRLCANRIAVRRSKCIGDSTQSLFTALCAFSKVDPLKMHLVVCTRHSLTTLANDAPLLLITRSSIEALHEQLNNGGIFDIDSHSLVRRFRPNLVVDGVACAFDEERWRRIRIGDCELEVVGVSTRCEMITIDQMRSCDEEGDESVGRRQRDRCVMAALSALRSGRLRFGVYVRLVAGESESSVGIGDAVRVLEETESW